MNFLSLGIFSRNFKKKINSLLYIFDCISYTIMFFSLFLFISFLSTNEASKGIYFFDILIFIVTLLQILRPIIKILFKDKQEFIREISLSFLFASIYFFFYQINSLALVHNTPLVLKVRTIIEIFFYSIYIIFTFPRVSSFFKLIRMDFLYSFTFGFIFLIFFGAWILSLPISRNIEISLLDLIFTSTSAVTVTGLSLIDISQDLTFFGQFVMLLLIQIGGLGILTFSTLYLVNLKNKLSFEERVYTVELFAAKEMKHVNSLLRGIVLSTIFIEVIGAILLYIGTLDYNISPSHRLFFAVFHSVNAFCNAGFSLVSSSLRYFYDHSLVLYTISILVILGGLGFVALLDLKKKFLYTLRIGKVSADEAKFSQQTKLILILSFILIIFGAIAIYYFEYSHTLLNLSEADKVNNSLFQSIVVRTAGFSSISTINLQESSLWVIMILMFIGTAPNSTGGGVKITTIFILIWALLKVLLHRIRSQEPLLGFNFSQSLIAKAGLILFLRLIILIVSVFLLSIYEPGVSLSALLFEAVTAFSTAGVTLDFLPTIAPQSKIIFIVLMFIGRVGSFYILSNIFPIKEKKSSIKRKQQTLSLE